jgi:NAD+ synthetase
MVGYPEYADGHIYNSALLLRGGRTLAHHRKAVLPNYKVFDEKRYFTPGTQATVVEFDGWRLGLLICEDVWEPEPVRLAAALGAEVLLVINASPYEIHKQREREQVLGDRIREVQLPAAYVNLLGGQDELVFDGNSFAMDAQARVVMRADAFKDGLYSVDFERRGAHVVPVAGSVAPELSDEESVYRALVLGVRDYVTKHGFPGAVMGLSGGVDSALTLAIAVDALGPERVHAVMMPSRYTSAMSREDATAQAQALGVTLSSISIEDMFAATLAALAKEFAGRKPDATEENIQARCRGVLLMAISNKTGRMLLTTGNKSEMAVGYATLYGDMAGGFAPIKDCSKMLVYRLAHYRNTLSAAIPERVIEREPTAELRPRRTPIRCRRTKCSIRSSKPSSRMTCRWRRSASAVTTAPWSRACSTWSSGPNTSGGRRRPVYASAGVPSDATGAIRSPTAIGASQRRGGWKARLSSAPELPPVLALGGPGLVGRRVIGLVDALDVRRQVGVAQQAVALQHDRERLLLGRCAVVLFDHAFGAARSRDVGTAPHVVARDIDLVLGQPVAQVGHAMQRIERVVAVRILRDHGAEGIDRLQQVGRRPLRHVDAEEALDRVRGALEVDQALHVPGVVHARVGRVLAQELVGRVDRGFLLALAVIAVNEIEPRLARLVGEREA